MFCTMPCSWPVYLFIFFFQGKTLFYAHHFSQTHERISPQELFEADPSLSLRAVILKVVSVINKVGDLINTLW